MQTVVILLFVVCTEWATDESRPTTCDRARPLAGGGVNGDSTSPPRWSSTRTHVDDLDSLVYGPGLLFRGPYSILSKRFLSNMEQNMSSDQPSEWRGLRRGSAAAGLGDCEFEIRRDMDDSLVSAVCCQVETSASG